MTPAQQGGPQGAGTVAAGSASASPFPGFDGLRLFAAFGVLLSHAFLIPTGGAESADALVRALGRLGYYGVFTFFIISGFLLARSLDREPDALRFAVNRVLRIYPGLLVCALFTALVIGPLATSLPWRQYWADPDVPGYVRVTIECLCARGWLPGLYGYAGFEAMRPIVNGSLWSLSYEVLSYLLLLALWLLWRRVAATVLSLVALLVATALLAPVHEALAGVAFTLPYFAGGALMYLVHQRFGLSARVAALCALALAAGIALDQPGAAYTLFGPYLLVCLATRPNPGSALSARVGDLSYGLYLYGWPVQQVVKQLTGTSDPWLMLALSAPATALLAWASFRLVERPALRLKAPVTAWLRRAIDGTADAAAPRRRAGAACAFLAAVVAMLLLPGALWWFVSASVAAATAAALLGARLSSGVGAVWARWRLRPVR